MGAEQSSGDAFSVGVIIVIVIGGLALPAGMILRYYRTRSPASMGSSDEEPAKAEQLGIRSTFRRINLNLNNPEGVDWDGDEVHGQAPLSDQALEIALERTTSQGREFVEVSASTSTGTV